MATIAIQGAVVRCCTVVYSRSGSSSDRRGFMSPYRFSQEVQRSPALVFSRHLLLVRRAFMRDPNSSLSVGRNKLSLHVKHPPNNYMFDHCAICFLPFGHTVHTLLKEVHNQQLLTSGKGVEGEGRVEGLAAEF